MVGKKGYKISESGIEVDELDNSVNSDFILDLDELHMNVTPPSELNENCSPKTEDKRKKVRQHRHILNFTMDTQHAYNKCHQCRRKNLKYGLIKCARKECSILYCNICIKKYNQQYNICFYCQRVCKCKICRNKFDNYNKFDEASEAEEDEDYHSLDDQNLFKIDDFTVIEKKDSEFDVSETDEKNLCLLENHGIKKKSKKFEDKISTNDLTKKGKNAPIAKLKKFKQNSENSYNNISDSLLNNLNNPNNSISDTEDKNKKLTSNNNFYEKEIKINLDYNYNNFMPSQEKKNKKTNKIKNMKAEKNDNEEKSNEKSNSELIKTDSVPLNSDITSLNQKAENQVSNKEDIKSDKNSNLDRPDKQIIGKNKLKKNETSNLINNINSNSSDLNLNFTNNSSNPTKKEKIKKEKPEKLEKLALNKIEIMEKNEIIKNNENAQLNNLNNNNNPINCLINNSQSTNVNLPSNNSNNSEINSTCLKNIEIPSKNYIKAKKSVYKNCLYCKNDKINIMTILRFKSSEEFILYSKHFYEKLSEESLNIYKESKANFEKYFNDYYKKCSQSNNFTFKSIKYICMSCFEENLKDEHGFSNILNTLQYGLNPIDNKYVAPNKLEDNISNPNPNNNINTENKLLSMEPHIDLNIRQNEKNDLLKQKKKYNKKKQKNSEEDPKSQNISNTPKNLTNLSNNIESNTDKDIINNMISYNYNKSNKKFPTNESITNPNVSNLNNNIIPNLIKNQSQITSNYQIFPPITPNIVNTNSSSNINNNIINQKSSHFSANFNNELSSNLILNQENNINNNHLNNNKFMALNNSNSQTPNMSNDQLQNNFNLHNTNTNNLSSLGNSLGNNIPQQSSHINNPNSLNHNNNYNSNNNPNSLNNNDLNIGLSSESKLDGLNQVISQGIDDLYNTTKENLSNVTDGMNVTNIIMNFEQNKEELSNKLNLKGILDDLKKQFFSINYYSLLQKLFISYIFKNLETFVEQISKNQILGDFIINNIIQNIPKMQESPDVKNNQNSLQISALINTINDQINSLKNINNQGQFLTSSLNGVFDELKTNGNKIFENVENTNKINNLMNLNMGMGMGINLPGINLDSGNEMNLKNFMLNQNPFLGININNMNYSTDNNANSINNQIAALTQNSSNFHINNQIANEMANNSFLHNNNFFATKMNQNINNNNNNLISLENNKNINNNNNSELSQNNQGNNNKNQNFSNANNDINALNQQNSKNVTNASKEKVQSLNNNSLNNMSSNTDKNNLRSQHNANQLTQTANLNILNNNNNQINFNSLLNQNNQIQQQGNSLNQHSNNTSTPILDKMISQKANNTQQQIQNNINLGKLSNNPQQNLVQEINSLSMLQQGNHSNIIANLFPGIQKNNSNQANISNFNGIIGLNPISYNVQGINNMNNQILQQQNYPLINMNSQILPMQMTGVQCINPMQNTINFDLINKLQGGMGYNGVQNINGLMGNQQINFIGGIPINQRIMLENNNNNNQQNVMASSLFNPMDVKLQVIKKMNNENE